jgi:Trypsin-like peptidase domain
MRANMPDRRWLLTYTGIAVLAECRAWDVRRDLALLKVIAVEADDGAANAMASLCHVTLAGIKRMSRTDVVCIGQPGGDDLESTTARKTMYNLFEISYGQLRGLMPRVDPQDNAEIGALKHDAWTYWGHSGAPLLKEDDGTLVGLHSSWDSQTAMRHAVPLVAIEGFLKERLPTAKGAAAAS